MSNGRIKASTFFLSSSSLLSSHYSSKQGFKAQRDYCVQKKRLKLILNLLEFLFYGTCTLVLKVYESTVGGMILEKQENENLDLIIPPEYQEVPSKLFQQPTIKTIIGTFTYLHMYMYNKTQHNFSIELINQSKDKTNCINQHTTLPHQLGRRLTHLEI